MSILASRREYKMRKRSQDQTPKHVRVCSLRQMVKRLFRSSSPASRQTLSPEPHVTLVESSMALSIAAVQRVLTQWYCPSPSSSHAFLFSSDTRHEAVEFIGAVKDLQYTMHRLVSVNSASEMLVRAQNLMQTSMRFLESEFCRILKANREYLDPESLSVRPHKSCRFSISSLSDSDGDSDFDAAEDDDGDETRFSGVDSDTMDDLKVIAECMISTGYTKECVRVYKTERRSIAEETLRGLGIERLSLHHIQKMEWEKLEDKIKSWLSAVKFAVRKLFYGERFLADHVFSSSPAIPESSFIEIAREAAVTLFGFPENAAKFKKLSPEKMFRILDMYEVLANLFPEIESIFHYDSTAIVRAQVVNSLNRLGESVRSMMIEFESAIHKYSSKKPVPGGGVHPLTGYVMNYLVFIADYRDSIAAIFENWQLDIPSPLPESLLSGELDTGGGEDTHSSPVSVRLAWLILLTLCKIDGKAQAYKDLALSYLFLANNLQFVVAKVRSSNLKLLLGDDWVARHKAKVKQHAEKMEKMAWGKLMTSLPEDPTAEISPEQAKEMFRRFNEVLQSAYRKQSSWVVTDPELRDEIKISLSQKLMHGFTRFYERNQVELVRETCSESIVIFTPEDLRNYISDLYIGSRISGSVSRKRSGSGSGFGFGFGFGSGSGSGSGSGFGFGSRYGSGSSSSSHSWRRRSR